MPRQNHLIEVQHEGKFDEANSSALFIADYKDFQVKGEAVCDFSIDEHKEVETGIMKDSYYLFGIKFEDFTVMDDASDIVKLTDVEELDVKNAIENYFNELVQEF